MARHAETADAGAENGMILIVASICPGRTTANSGNVAMVIASSTAFIRCIAGGIDDRQAGLRSACRLARPVAAGATDTPAPARLRSDRRGGLVFGNVRRLQPRHDDGAMAGARQ